MENFLLQFLNGLVSGMVLFIMAAGLSLIFGQMNVINLSHGAYYLLGSYIGYTMVTQVGNFWLALIIAGITLMTIQIYQKIIAWEESPINTKIEIKYPSELPFPMVTICNTNQFK